MKSAAINHSFKLLILTSFIVSANFAMASGDIAECQPAFSQIEELNKPSRLFAPNLFKHLNCAKVNHYLAELSQKNVEALCGAYATCDKSLEPSNAHDVLAKFITKKRLADELPRSMIYNTVKKFLEKENAFPAHAMENGKIAYHCATGEYTIDESISYRKSKDKNVSCKKSVFNKYADEYYRKCGQNKNCFGDLDEILGDSRNINDKGNNSRDIEGFIQKNTAKLAEYYQSQDSDEYVEEIRLALLEKKDLKTVLKKYRKKSPVLMAMFMSSEDFATRKMLEALNPIFVKEITDLQKAPKASSADFKAAFKKFQITVGQGMFASCKDKAKDKFFPFTPSEICKYGGKITDGDLEVLKADQYSNSELVTLYNELKEDLTTSGNSDARDNAVDLVCKTMKYAGSSPSKLVKGATTAGAYSVGNSADSGGINSFRYPDLEGSSDYSANAAMDHEQDIAIINKTAADFGKTEAADENAVIQANNQNLRGQDSVDSQAFINNFKPIDNYSGLTNEYVNKSYINRADKLKTESTSSSSEANLNKQYSDIEAKIAEAEARLKELQQGMGEVGKNKNQPVVSNGVSREKTQSSSEIEELLKEIKELKAQNNEIKEKLVAKANTEKAEKVAEKQAGSFNNSPGLAFSSGNKNDYKFESKPVEIKPTSSYSSSQGNSQAMRAPSSLGAAKLGAQASGAILSAVDNKADAVTPARAVTRVDSFNSESARKAITSRINEINKNTKEMEQSKATIEIDGQLKEVISFEVLDEKGQKKLVVVELKDGKVVVDKDGNPIYVSQDMTDDSIIITKKGKDEKSVKKLQSQADVKRVDELKLQKGRSAERVKLNDLTRSAVKAKP